MPEVNLLHELLDQAAARTPEATATGRRHESLTYAGLDRASRRLAGWLTSRGLRRGDRLLIAADELYVPALIFAASRVGVAFAIIHEQVRGAVLEHMLADAQPGLVIADRDDWHAAGIAAGIVVERTSVLRSAAEVTAAGDTAPGDTAPGDTAPGDTVSGDPPIAVDMVCLIYTSGSTALPKAVVSTHQQVLFAVRAIASQLAYTGTDVVFSPLPLSFDYGLYQVFLSVFAGACLYQASGSEVGPSMVAAMLRTGATVLPAVPNIADTLAKLLRRATDRPALRLMTNTGSAMNPATLAELRTQLPELRVQLMFGLTECKRVAIMPPDGDLTRTGCGGRPLPGTEAYVIDEDGRRLPAGEIGELVVRGPHVMSGYWRQPDLTAARFHRREGLLPELRTGDYAWFDAEGFLYFAGRRDDQYKSGAFRVSAVEVEAAACRVPGVRRAGVLPPGPGRPAAVLYAATDLTPDEVLAGLRLELEDVKVPPVCVVVPELPLNGNGKVDKKVLDAR